MQAARNFHSIKFVAGCVTKQLLYFHESYTVVYLSGCNITIFLKKKLKGKMYSAPLYRHWGSVQAVRPIGGVEV